MKKIIIGVLVCLPLANAFASRTGLTSHSVANCENNESISWSGQKMYNLSVYSRHTKYDSRGHVKTWHNVDTGYKYTYRQRAVCWLEPQTNKGHWKVTGWHYWKDDETGGTYFLGRTEAENCNQYNGWDD
ncbi:hypothetical protein YTPLAS21_19440 [Candidatus Nitrosocosmicus sp.]|nr:hypothetical protein YTPLAS21_19440 [Candidatus Nitrosocosmicus sp.]